jgi:hypothetical protein
VKSLLHHKVRHPTREDIPHLPRQAVLNFADGDAELDELLLGLVHARPLIAVSVHACVEEAVAASAAGLKVVGKLGEHVVDLLTVLLDATRVEPHGLYDDPFGDKVTGGVLAFLEHAVREDGVHKVTGQNVGFGTH